jgi:AraC-like DNA-binding protein
MVFVNFDRFGLPPAPLLEVELEYPRPEHASAIEAFFGVPCRFGSGRNALVTHVTSLDIPSKTADSRLHAVLARHAQDLVERTPRPARFSDRVRELVAQELNGGNPSLESIAARLKMSSSTVRRRLREEGITHRELTDDLRKQLAHRYLNDPELTVTQVAFVLGFSRLSAFTKAFQRWSGTSPAAYRRRRG